MKIKHLIMLSLAAISIIGCNSSDIGGSDSTTVSGAATDDYIIGGDVEIYNSNGKKLKTNCKTEDYGLFSCQVNGLKSGENIAIIVKNGQLDKDGNSSTTDDQYSFPGALGAVTQANKSIIVSPLTSNLFTNNDLKIDGDGNDTIAYLDIDDLNISNISSKFDDILKREHNLPTKVVLDGDSKVNIKKHTIATTKFMKGKFDDLKNLTNKENYRLHILHINDTHSHLEPTRISVKINGNKTYLYTGGYAKIAKYVKDTKSADNHTIFLHAGDAVQGTLYYNLFGGKAGLEALNEMDIDAMTLGNHAFDKGIDNLTNNFIAKADFPIVSADVDVTGKDESIFKKYVKSYKILDIDGEKVGIVGETVDSSKLSLAGPTVQFLDYVDTAKKAIEDLKKEKVNKIIFLTHIGYDKDKWLASQVKDIDVIVGGHSHTMLGNFKNLSLSTKGAYPTVVENEGEKTLIVTAWKWGNFIGDLNVVFDKNGNVISCAGTPVILSSDKFLRKDKDGKKQEVNATVKQDIVNFINNQTNIQIEGEDSKVASIIDKYKPKVDELMNKTIGTASAYLAHVRLPGVVDEDNGEILSHGSMIAPLVALGMYEKTFENGLNVDFSLQNAGGVRHSIADGNVTYGSIQTMLPFGNTLVTLDMLGSDIKEMIENAIDRAYIEKTNTGAFPYLGNAKFTIDANATKGSRIVEFKIKADDGNWTDLDSNKIYTIATNSYIAGGGDNYDEFVNNSTNKYDTGFVDNEDFIDYVKKHKVLNLLPADELPVTVIGAIDQILKGAKKPMPNLDFSLGKAIFPNGFVLDATWGIGSAATHKAGDDNTTFYSMTDRGVNIKCKDSKDITGEKICKDGKIFPFPSFSPTIFKWKIEGNKLKLLSKVNFLDDDNKSVSGLTNPLPNFDEPAYDVNGSALTMDPNGLDTEALAALKDGSFWVGEEYGPSILHVGANGHILERIVPKGLEDNYSKATYKVIGGLPEILQKRHPNRGIEALTISPDEKTLYFAMQSPLDNPSYKDTNRTRLYKMDLSTNSITEYLYELDAPDTFIKDSNVKKRKQKDVKLSEMSILKNGDLVILERISTTTKLYRVDLSDATSVPSDLSDTLETSNSNELKSISKTLIFSTDYQDGFQSKIEGVANLGGGNFLLVNDNDFGIESDKTIAKVVNIDIDK